MCIYPPAFLPITGSCSHYIKVLAIPQTFLETIAGSVWIVLFLSSLDYIYLAISWFTVFGGTAINMQLEDAFDLWSVLETNGLESAVFNFFAQFPLGTLLVILFLIIIVISFVTMADSMTSVAAIMSTSGFQQEDGEPPLFLKVSWGLIMGSLAWVMISFAGIDGTKMLAVLASFPLLFIMIALAMSAIKGLYYPNQDFSQPKAWNLKRKKHAKES